MKEVKREKMVKSPSFVDRGAYAEQRYYESSIIWNLRELL